MENKSRNAVLLIIIIVLLVIGLIYLFINNLKLNGNNDQTKNVIPALVDKTPKENQNNIINTPSYVNTTYGFSFSFPKTFPLEVYPDSETKRGCSIIDNTNDKGINYAHNEEVNLEQGTLIPLSFSESSSKLRDLPFMGSIGYKIMPECEQHELVRTEIFKKDVDFNFDSFMKESTESLSTGISGGVTGGGATEIKIPVNGKDITVIRGRDGSAMGNTTDYYYFDHGSYIYMLTHSYSQAAIDANGEDQQKYFGPDLQDYQLSIQIIKGFSFIN